MAEIAIECEPYGPVWCLAQPWNELPSLKRECEEYFALGIELSPGDVVVDVGANIGMFALAAAARTPGLRILAFEPIPQIFSALEKNLTHNPVMSSARVECLRTALGRLGDEGEHDFHLIKRFPANSTRYGEEKREELAATFVVLARAWQSWAGARGLYGPAGRALGRTIEALPRRPAGRWVLERLLGVTRVRCPVSTLSRVIEERGLASIDLLKIDVEGAELDVLEGLRAEHWPRVKAIVLEGSDHEGRLACIERLLTEHGFTDVRRAAPAETRERDLSNFLLFASR